MSAGTRTAAEVVARARELADDVLFPAAAAVDAGERSPREHLDRLAAEGFHGLAVPGGGLEYADFARVVELLAGGCLTTAFVWLQHHGAVRAVAASGTSGVRDAWLGPLTRGERRAGVALAGAVRPGPAALRATRTDGGWRLDGEVPWVTGWGHVDVLHTAARTPEDDLVLGLVDAGDPGLTPIAHDLVAVGRSGTVDLAYDAVAVPDDRVTAVRPLADHLATDATGLGLNGHLAVGVAERCARLVGPGPLDDEVEGARRALLDAPPAALPAARAAASALASRAAAACVTAAGSRSIRRGEPAERLAREAVFLLVFASRPPIGSALLAALGAV